MRSDPLAIHPDTGDRRLSSSAAGAFLRILYATLPRHRPTGFVSAGVALNAIFGVLALFLSRRPAI
jgi:hypothetical protein